MKNCLILLFSLLAADTFTFAQTPVNLAAYSKKSGVNVSSKANILNVTWPAGKAGEGKLVIDLEKGKSLFSKIQLVDKGGVKEIASGLDPAFVLTVGKRDLISQNGWNIFFDKTNKLPHQTHTVQLDKQDAAVISEGSRTIIRIGEIKADRFSGDIEITLYNGSPLFNVAAVMATEVDSTAIIYDAGLISKQPAFGTIAWANTANELQNAPANPADTITLLPVKYRTIIGEGKQGSLALFPAPHQYFYPLDEAFNLKFTWYGNNYLSKLSGYGMGIRHDLMGDRRWVPWFNAPPKTQQRLNFFCLLNAGKAAGALEEVKQFTYHDSYKPLEGYKTMASHFHNEYVMNVILKGKPQPDTPNFKKVFKATGVDVVHLGEFHYTAHPKGPDDQRLLELKTLFDMCKRYSDDEFLLLPGEEPNEFYGGHWMQFFPNPVYWIMARKPDQPFVTNDPKYGKVYRVGNKEEMLKLLEAEKGLAWTAHARTKGSTGYPDKYKDEAFFKSDRFFGAAWKAIPGDLSTERLGKRVFDLMDDMANWGLKKYAIAEADLFTIEPENEMWAHLNINYLQLDKLPKYTDGWQPVLTAMETGKFFSSTGEVLLPSFTVNGKQSGDTVKLATSGKAKINLEVAWTFPLNFVEIISGDGKQVFREKINLENTQAFGKQKFTFSPNLKNRKWVRIEVWDAAVNGAFTQFVWLE